MTASWQNISNSFLENNRSTGMPTGDSLTAILRPFVLAAFSLFPAAGPAAAGVVAGAVRPVLFLWLHYFLKIVN